MIERETVLEEANELGLEFKKNTPTNKLMGMIAEAKGETPAPPEEGSSNSDSQENTVQSKPISKAAFRRKKIAAAKKAAFVTHVVTITNKDNRENSYTTTVHLSFENQHFGLSKIVPLDIPVELEQALIDNAEGTMMTLHKDEIIDGKRTGNNVPVTVKKFAISYSKNV